MLKRENELLTGINIEALKFDCLLILRPEIRELDGERQSLVYNHHHELIAASDTIAAVKNFDICYLLQITPNPLGQNQS